MQKKIGATLFLPFFIAFFGIAHSETQAVKRISLTFLAGICSGFSFGRLIPLPQTADVPEVVIVLENKSILTGMSLGYKITDCFEIQGTFTYVSSRILNDVGIGLAGIPLGKVKIADAKNLSISGNILFHIPIKEYSLFFSAGAGAVTLKPEGLTTRTRLLLNCGTGFSVNWGEHFRSILQIQDFVSFFDFSADFGLRYPLIYSLDIKKTQHHLGFQIGLGYGF